MAEIKSMAKKVADAVWEVPKTAKEGMNVPARVIATDSLFEKMDAGVFEQITNVACLPGIQRAAYCMPDGHWGYGFPIGGVAAFSEEDGIISPGGVGYDINCGVRLMRTNLTFNEVKPKLKQLLDALFANIPCGLGSHGAVKLTKSQFEEVITEGVNWCIENGYGWEADAERCEDNGRLDADSSKVSEKAANRGYDQVGTLGSGNHFLEVQTVEDIFDPETAKNFGLTEPKQIVVMIHCGSRGFGHQIATEYIRVMDSAVKKYNIKIKDRELVCAPFHSDEGKDYFSAMNCAVNNAFANRQVIMHLARKSFEQVFKRTAEDMEMELIYDVCHNVAKREEYKIDGKNTKVIVHRKGATRAFAAGHKGNPDVYRKTGHPVIIPGSMGSSSFVCIGTEKAEETFFSSCHGAGRSMSRAQALKQFRGERIKQDMEAKGFAVRAKSMRGLAEEASGAYKNVTEVVHAAEQAGVCRLVARLHSLATMKG